MPTRTESLGSKHRILITGAGSFSGGKILRLLDRESVAPVVAVDLERPRFSLRNTKFYKLNLMGRQADSELFSILKKENIHTVIHAAFPITPPKNGEFAHELISIGTMYLLNACMAARVKRLILLSTADVYGAFPDNPNFMTEVQAPRGNRLSRFLADKIDAERQALEAHALLPNMEVLVLRIATILGPTVETYKTRYLRRQVVPTILGYDPLVQFIHEDDVAEACRLAITRGKSGVYNVSAKGVMPLSRVIEICGKINLRLPLVGVQSFTQALWYMDLSPAPATHLNFIKYLWLVDPEKAYRELEFRPKFTSKEALLSFVGAEQLREVRLFKGASA